MIEIRLIARCEVARYLYIISRQFELQETVAVLTSFRIVVTVSRLQINISRLVRHRSSSRHPDAAALSARLGTPHGAKPQAASIVNKEPSSDAARVVPSKGDVKRAVIEQ